jgi:hypothetical protein
VPAALLVVRAGSLQALAGNAAAAAMLDLRGGRTARHAGRWRWPPHPPAWLDGAAPAFAPPPLEASLVLAGGQLARGGAGHAGRWTLPGLALPGGDACGDLAPRRRAEQAQALLLRELDHRVKNLFAVIAGLVTFSARGADTPQDMRATLLGRIDALARAHDLVKLAIGGGFAAAEGAAHHTTLRALAEAPAGALSQRRAAAAGGRGYRHRRAHPPRRWRWCCTSWRPTRAAARRAGPPGRRAVRCAGRCAPQALLLAWDELCPNTAAARHGRRTASASGW